MTQPKAEPDIALIADYPALQQLARSLWKFAGLRGAAVLIGAGFSRDAILTSPDTPPPPLWKDLADAMTHDLYPGTEGMAPWDPLRLAEEYRAYFGQSALDAFIRHHIRDSSWNPSASHARLLSLPWADVLTTNYDTLLERAARLGDIVYDPVRSTAEIAFAKAPRIIKLHGSMGANADFIIAEEDYRTYADRRGAFVNLARQCFVENELVMLGFSGDDPNFLAWAGWVRDHLRGGARRIYLAGALNLNPAKRKYLESHNIAPIDVHDAVAHVEPADRHAAATRLILNALHALKPPPLHDWTPTQQGQNENSLNCEHARAMISAWTADRRAYPGWLVCPQGARLTLRLNSTLPSIKLIEQLAAGEAATLMRELCWRRDAALTPLFDDEVALIQRFADPVSSPDLDEEGRIAIALALQHYADEDGHDQLFETMTALIADRARVGSDMLARSYYRQALRTVRQMDFAQALALATNITGDDPAFGLSRTNVLVRCGQIDDARSMLSATLTDLRDRERDDRGSLWIRSRLAWALFHQNGYGRPFGSNFQRWPEGFRESRCDPWFEIDRFKEAVTEKVEKAAVAARRLRPNFEPGSYARAGRSIQFGTHVPLAIELTRFFEISGVPPRGPHVNLFTEQRVAALQFDRLAIAEWYRWVIAAGLTTGMPEFERDFSRIAMAVLGAEDVNELFVQLSRARDYWLERRTTAANEEFTFATERLETVLAMIARLAIRLDDGRAEALHIETVTLWTTGRLRDHRLVKPVTSLLESTIKTVAPAARETMAIADLTLPLVEHYNSPDPVPWLNHVDFKGRKRRPGLRPIVDNLLRAVEGQGEARDKAISRLTFLQHEKILTPSEAQKFARASWSQLDGETPPLPAATSVFPFFWATLGVPQVNAAQNVRERVFRLSKGEIEPEQLDIILRAVRAGKLMPNAKEARTLFDRIVVSRFAEPDRDDLAAIFDTSMRGLDARQANSLAGACLSWALAPNLVKGDRVRRRMTALLKFIDETGSPAAVAALLPFVTMTTARNALENHIRRGLLSLDGDEASYAGEALVKWAESDLSEMQKAPDALVEQLIAVIEVQQSPALWRLMGLAVRLARAGRLDDNLRNRLDVKLGDLLVATSYDRITLLSEDAGRISLVRQQAVRLALALRAAGSTNPAINDWLAAAATDPLPEVRHALTLDKD
ncbi:SIR2 family NAD-dependent protein deacylase [Sphingomonas sp.]|uniref:SIR2 family NAD-dependent protein deacylase n=1 Tax=Sphingomonas sp. TaxID=28214 RepID=UPI003AFFA870